jgi:hypothetical protein
MKTSRFTLVLTAFVLISTLSFSQSVEGRLSIKGFTNGEIKEQTPVALFKAFKDGAYTINFNFKSSNVGSEGIVLFDMKTTVKHNGKIISETSRGGWPWIPGDMFVPVEAFDFIPAWQKYAEKGLPVSIPGKYEIILQFVPTQGQKVKGNISPTAIQFTIK